MKRISVLSQWILSLKSGSLEKLMKEPPKSDCAEDLLSGIRDMLSGEVTSLSAERIRRGGSSLARPAGRDADWRTGNQPQKQEGRHGGAEVSLTPKEFDILYFLAQNRGEVFTKEQIYRAVWSEDYLWTTATSWHLSENYGRKLSLTQTRPSTF